MRHPASAILLACIVATGIADERETLGEAATWRYLQDEMQDAAAASGDPHVLLLGSYLERAYRAAPYDPLVLVSVYARCMQSPGARAFCYETDWAGALAEVDPDNGANWLRLARISAEAGEQEATRSALRAAAVRPRYDGYTGRYTHAMYQALHRLAPEGRTLDPFVLAVFALRIAASIPKSDIDFVPPCRMYAEDDPHIANLCRAIAWQLLEDPHTVHAGLAAADWLERAGGLSDMERSRIERLGKAYTGADAALEGFEHRLRDDHAMLERFLADMGVHGEYAAWTRLREALDGY